MSAAYGPSPTNRRPRRTKTEIAAVETAIYTTLQADHPQTLRGLFYQLVSQGVVPKTEVEAYVRDYAARIAANAPLTVKAAKMASEATTKDPDRRDLARVDAAVNACFDSEDYAEGRRAFLEKRKPRFQGR